MKQDSHTNASRSGIARTAIRLAFGLAALLLCWEGTSWALRPAGQDLLADEFETLCVGHPLSYGLTFFPQWIYNDRPVGFLFDRVLFAHYGFNYTAQVGWFLAVHFAVAALAFFLFRRLGVSVELSIAGVAVFGSLSTTAQTATYLGAAFDVFCTFFLLAATLSLLRKGWQGVAASTLLFFLALRSKEFAICAPVMFTLFLLCTAEQPFSWRRFLTTVRNRLWPQYLLAAVFAARYASFIPRMRASIGAGDSYHMDLSPLKALDSLSYYTALIFAQEGSLGPGWKHLPLFALGAILCYSLIRRRAALFFSLSCYVLTLLPVCLLPNIRAPLYVYGPQIFLIAAICLVIEEIAGVFKRESRRWVFVTCVALVLLTSATLFRRGAYFLNRAAFNTTIRTTAWRTAGYAIPALSHIGHGAHVYLNHGQETPWLFTAGPCRFLSLITQGPITCIWHEPEAQLQAEYDLDPAEKYFVDYFADGSLKVRTGSAAAPVRP